ncbi:MAG: hypothetical protein Q8M08_00865 [Bacteroidales bacterium]|nr:hypothetical protein [Bacteroidales bacterium]
MKKNMIFSLILVFSSIGSVLFGQSESLHPSKIKNAVYFDVSPRLDEMQVILPGKRKDDSGEKEVINRIGKRELHLRVRSVPLPALCRAVPETSLKACPTGPFH